jgi:hypothetical protein
MFEKCKNARMRECENISGMREYFGNARINARIFRECENISGMREYFGNVSITFEYLMARKLKG